MPIFAFPAAEALFDQFKAADAEEGEAIHALLTALSSYGPGAEETKIASKRFEAANTAKLSIRQQLEAYRIDSD